jgi:hypothetical protein
LFSSARRLRLGDQTILAATLDRIVLDPKLDDSFFRAPKR